jgi:hypothetical protein
MLVGMLAVAVLAFRVELNQQRSQSMGWDKSMARSYSGPERGIAAMRGTVGDSWLSVATSLQRPVKIGSVEADPRFGSGLSPARGGPGSEWGPVSLPQSAPLPQGAFAGLNSPIQSRLSYASRPLAAVPNDFIREFAISSDATYVVPIGLPRFLRQDKGDD